MSQEVYLVPKSVTVQTWIYDRKIGFSPFRNAAIFKVFMCRSIQKMLSMCLDIWIYLLTTNNYQ